MSSISDIVREVGEFIGTVRKRRILLTDELKAKNAEIEQLLKDNRELSDELERLLRENIELRSRR